MTKRNVFVVGNADSALVRMFKEFDWPIIDNIRYADVVQFTGGEDITPSFYNQGWHPKTGAPNITRDKKEAYIFQMCKQVRKPMLGICRGGQFLNVMCGGDMWQDVDNHCSDHMVKDEVYNIEYKATSTHHQQMIPTDKAVLIAHANVSRKKSRMGPNGAGIDNEWNNEPVDPEVVYYEEENCLCFQPHPELAGYKDLANIYRIYIDDLVFEGH